MSPVGIAVWELLTGGNQKPFPTLKNIVDISFHHRDVAPRILDLPDHTPPLLKNILFRCWAYDPADRPEMDEIVQTLLRWPTITVRVPKIPSPLLLIRILPS